MCHLLQAVQAVLEVGFARSPGLGDQLPDAICRSCRANRDAFLHLVAGQYLVHFGELSFKQQIGDGSVRRVHLGKWQVRCCTDIHLHTCEDCCQPFASRILLVSPLTAVWHST